MPSLIQLQKRSHTTARQKGWWGAYTEDGALFFPNVPHMVEEKVVLVHSEISEALEDYREGKMVTTLLESGKPVGFPTELADIAIRWMDLFGALGITPMNARKTIPELSEEVYTRRVSLGWFQRMDLGIAERGDDQVVPQALCRMHMGTSRSLNVFSRWASTGVPEEAFAVLGDVMAIAWHLKLDLEKEIETKQDYNDLRPHRHGGKRV